MVNTLLTITLLHWLLLVTPGANTILISQLAASGHRGSACIASWGISIVAVIWAVLAILGVNALFAAHSQLRLAVQIMGGIYLCYVAFKLWRSGIAVGQPQSAQIAPWAAFRLGFLTNATNPKAPLFFGSVFATALPADSHSLLPVAAVTLVFVNALAWHTFLAVAFSHPRVQAGYDRQRKLLNRVASLVIGAYGLRLLITTADEARLR
jgi:threonine efflux protein